MDAAASLNLLVVSLFVGGLLLAAAFVVLLSPRLDHETARVGSRARGATEAGVTPGGRTRVATRRWSGRGELSEISGARASLTVGGADPITRRPERSASPTAPRTGGGRYAPATRADAVARQATRSVPALWRDGGAETRLDGAPARAEGRSMPGLVAAPEGVKQ